MLFLINASANAIRTSGGRSYDGLAKNGRNALEPQSKRSDREVLCTAPMTARLNRDRSEAGQLPSLDYCQTRMRNPAATENSSVSQRMVCSSHTVIFSPSEASVGRVRQRGARAGPGRTGEPAFIVQGRSTEAATIPTRPNQYGVAALERGARLVLFARAVKDLSVMDTGVRLQRIALLVAWAVIVCGAAMQRARRVSGEYVSTLAVGLLPR